MLAYSQQRASISSCMKRCVRVHTVEEINKLTKVKDYFIEQMKELVEEEEKLVAAYHGQVPADADLKQAKLDGFSDKYLSQILGVSEEAIRTRRTELGVVEGWEGVHVSGY